MKEVFADSEIARSGRLELTVGRVRAGFHMIDARTLVIGDHELFARTDVRRPTTRRRYESRAIDSFLDLNEGDLVVHVNHGIARYRGLTLVNRSAEHDEETLLLEFAEGTKLYVPIAKIDLVQKYVGGGRGDPPLSKMGSSAWEKRKKRVAEAVVDLAAMELIDIQAARATRPGFAFPAEDSHWMAEFEASFPYQETPDQLAAIEAIKEDMAKPRPMDRLICGDVGYGKTEVAMRGAFKAVDGGKQVAVLVPTTVLAEQHHRTFSARMAEFPFTIEVVNRFRAKSEIKDALKRTAAGSVDVLIGTHRLVQKDVVFKDLGLVVIDEEQRFGVEDKEWLKSLRSTVDVLTLSATPIPRTLHMSLLGIRDISNLETPPPDRKAIETRILRWDDETIKRAIHRELNREGQVYFVHNRVHDIRSVADRIQAIVPEARIAIAHGQMTGEVLLEKTMLAFLKRKADILLATTIIESGLDIPNVNTIFINEADKYGLADLHQLRGRVGRYKHRAYAYLLLESNKSVSPNAVKRLKAIEEFTTLGAGFKIALRDLEIRGAGNILGAEQSGHIESVGYELYCSLLEAAVRSLTSQPDKGAYDCSIELAWRAYLPKDYVPGPKVKVELYRRLGRLRSLNHLSDFRKELVDRFGPLPRQAENLLAEAEIRILAEHWAVARMHVEDEYAVLTYRKLPAGSRPWRSGIPAGSASSTSGRRTSRWRRSGREGPSGGGGAGQIALAVPIESRIACRRRSIGTGHQSSARRPLPESAPRHPAPRGPTRSERALEGDDGSSADRGRARLPARRLRHGAIGHAGGLEVGARRDGDGRQAPAGRRLRRDDLRRARRGHPPRRPGARVSAGRRPAASGEGPARPPAVRADAPPRSTGLGRARRGAQTPARSDGPAFADPASGAAKVRGRPACPTVLRPQRRRPPPRPPRRPRCRRPRRRRARPPRRSRPRPFPATGAVLDPHVVPASALRPWPPAGREGHAREECGPGRVERQGGDRRHRGHHQAGRSEHGRCEP